MKSPDRGISAGSRVDRLESALKVVLDNVEVVANVNTTGDRVTEDEATGVVVDQPVAVAVLYQAPGKHNAVGAYSAGMTAFEASQRLLLILAR